MRTNPLVRSFLLLVALVAGNGAWAGETPQVVPQGEDTYSITVKGTHKFTRNTEKLKEQAMTMATAFCAKEGKQLKVVAVKEDKSFYLVGEFPQATLTFKALNPGAPELAAIEDHPKPPPPMTADLLTSELTKLDELRKKGLLTEEEFSMAKKKLLDRL